MLRSILSFLLGEKGKIERIPLFFAYPVKFWEKKKTVPLEKRKERKVKIIGLLRRGTPREASCLLCALVSALGGGGERHQVFGVEVFKVCHGTVRVPVQCPSTWLKFTTMDCMEIGPKILGISSLRTFYLRPSSLYPCHFPFSPMYTYYTFFFFLACWILTTVLGIFRVTGVRTVLSEQHRSLPRHRYLYLFYIPVVDSLALFSIVHEVGIG